MLQLEASLAPVFFFAGINPENVLVLEELDLDGVRQVLIDMTGQGHHLVAILVGTFYD